MADKIYKIGWFSTGRDATAGQLLKVICDNIKKKELERLAISFVFSNRIKGEEKESDNFFRLVEDLRINLVTFSSRNYEPDMRKKGFESANKGDSALINRWRNLYHSEAIRLISKPGIDLVVLAGYMLIAGRDLCHNYPMINLHPALPGGPRGTWQEVIWELIKQKVKESGAMMHLVTPQLDAGPVVTCCSFSLEGEKFDPLWKKMEEKLKRRTLEEIKEEEGEEEALFRKIREEGVRRELPLISRTLKVISEEEIRIVNGKIISDGQEVDGYCLSAEIEKK